MKVRTYKNQIDVWPEDKDTAPRIVLHGTGKGETAQGLMGWIELNLCPEDWKEVLVISAWNDKEKVGPHFEIASGADTEQGGVVRPISFWMNQGNNHKEVMRINRDGVLVYGKLFAYEVIDGSKT